MYITRPEQVQAVPMKVDGAEGVEFRLLIGHDHGAASFATRQLIIAPGGHTPQHQHNYEHQILVQSGKGLVRDGDTYRGIQRGDVVFLPPNRLHQIRNTGPEPLEFICLVPLQFVCGDGSCQPTPGT